MERRWLGCRTATALGAVAVACAVVLTIGAFSSTSHHRSIATTSTVPTPADSSRHARSTTTTTAAAHALAVTPAPPSTTTPPTATCPVQPLAGDGLWPVADNANGDQAPPVCGLLTDDQVPSLTQWITAAPTTGCTWTTYSSSTGDPGSVIATWSGTGQAIMSFANGVAAVRSQGCGRWLPWPESDSLWLGQPTPSTTAFGNGTYAFWLGISDGTWQASGGPGCHWSVLADFTGTAADVLASGSSTGPTTVTMHLTAHGTGDNHGGFTSQGCGTWTYVGGGSL